MTSKARTKDGRRLFNRKDCIFICAVVLLAFCAYVLSRTGRAENIQAEIRMNGRVVQTLSLQNDMVFPLYDHPAVQFIVENGRIAFYSSDCPDHICIRSGFLHIAGQTAVCLPNRIVLAIVGTAEDGDGIDVFLD